MDTIAVPVPTRPHEPHGALIVAGIPDRRWSAAQVDALERQAFAVAWAAARNPWHPNNRPVVERKLNALLWPDQVRDWREVWGVFVPGTPYVMNPRQRAVDLARRLSPVEAQETGVSAQTAAYLRWQARQRHIAALEQQVRADRDFHVRVFPSQNEAARFAQEIWRQHWSRRLALLTREARDRWLTEAVINPIVRARFSYDAADPAQVAARDACQAALAQQPLPYPVVWHAMHAAPPAPPAVADVESELDLLALQTWLDERDAQRQRWVLSPPAHTPAVDTVSLLTLPLGQEDTAIGLAFIRGHHATLVCNTAGRPAVFPADAQDAALAWAADQQLVVASKAVYDAGDYTVDGWPAMAPVMGDWRLRTWQQEQDAVVALMRQLPNAATRRTLQQAVQTIHDTLWPVTGVLAERPSVIDQLMTALLKQVRHVTPPDHLPTLEQAVLRWSRTLTLISDPALGLFAHADPWYADTSDPAAEPVPYRDAAGRFVIHPTPGGQFLLAAVDSQSDTVTFVQSRPLSTIREAQDAVRDRGDAPTVQRLPGVEEAWSKKVREMLPPDRADALIRSVLTPRPSVSVGTDSPPNLSAIVVRRQRLVELRLTPIGPRQAVVWGVDSDDGHVDFVAYRDGRWRLLNRRCRRPDPRSWQLGGPPWVVSGDTYDAIQATVQQITGQSAVWDWACETSMIRALVERWHIPVTVPQQRTDVIWRLHPSLRQTWVLTALVWRVAPKPQYPNEVTATLVTVPFQVVKPDGTRTLWEAPTEAAAWAAIRAYNTQTAQPLTVQHFTTLPGDAVDILERLTAAPERTPLVPTLSDPLQTLLRYGTPLQRQAALADLDDDETLAANDAARLLYRRLFVSGMRLTADDWAAIDPELATTAGVSWHDAAARLQAWVQQWLADHTRIAERLARAVQAAAS